MRSHFFHALQLALSPVFPSHTFFGGFSLIHGYLLCFKLYYTEHIAYTPINYVEKNELKSPYWHILSIISHISQERTRRDTQKALVDFYNVTLQSTAVTICTTCF
jgi:hypothetical protein